MVMLAQSAYSQYYQGWYPPVHLEESPEVSYVNPVTCASETRTAGTAIYVDGIYGDDSYAGTSTCPMKTLSGAVDDAVSNDEIIMQSGLYHDNVSIDGIDNLEIRAATGATVIFDGTRSITEDLGGVWGSADSDGIQEVTLTQDGWQLFLAHEEQVPARWPNAQFSDETVFNRSYMAEGTLTNSNNAYTIGWLTDAGPEAGVHTGLNETINATGLDPVGAIAVMNLGSFRSNSREITGWNASNGTFSYDGTGVGWKSKHHAYFLEGKRELIDVDGEWWYNNTDNTLHYKTPTNQDANDLDLRVKVQPFAISVDNSDGVTIQGIDFFGTTVNFNNCDGCSFTNSTLQYPSTSKRGLGIAGESEDDRWMTRFYRCKNTFVDRISITNTDGGALEFHGSGGQSHNNTVNNSYFHAIDWSAADQKGLMTTIYEGGRDMYFTNNSVHLTGASSVLSIGDAPKVFYNKVWDVGHLQTDGAVVQVMQGEAPGAEIAYNWIHDVIKYGARFDAPINEVGEGMNGTMHHNVIWNAAGGLMVKGDYHDIHNNTVFNSTGKNDIIFLTDGGINNKNSTLHYNAVDAMADHRSDDVFANPLPNGSHWSNWNGYVQGYDGMFEARNQHTCALYENSSLYCWGRNNYGQLGLGTTSSYEDSPQFVDVGSGLTVESMGISGSGDQASGPKSHTCAVLSDGQLKCWGDNADGQLGLGNVSSTGVWEPTAVNLGAGRTAVDVATANAATCALLDDQSVKCWGRNTRGQLGLGNDSSNDVLTPQLVTFSGSSKPIKLAGALRSFCAIMDNGTMACWGENANGQLGLGNQTSMVRSPTYLSTHTGRTVISVDLGKYFTCVSYDNGSVACTGTNDVGQLGLGNFTSSSTLQYVADMDVNAYRTDVAQKVGCAHLTNASLVCWGHDQWGLFGYSTNTYGQEYAFTANKYAVFPSGRTLASFSLGFTHACAVLDNGDLACWGNNNMAQLGLGNTSQQWIPVVVNNVSSIRKMAVHEMLVDPANNDFRPAWGSALQVRGAGAYDADDSNPWTAGISWNYTAPDAPVAGCMLDYADNYDSNAIVPDGSCLFSSYTPPSTLDLRLHLDPTNSSSYSGSGTNVADLSGFNNNGTVASAGPTWDADFTRFTYDGACTGSGPYVCDEIEIEDSTTLRPGEPYEDLAVKFDHLFSSTKSLKAPSTSAGYTLGAINTSFTVQVWLQPTDCETATDYQTFLHKEESYSFACKKGFFHYRLGNGTGWPDAWVNTSVNAVDDVWQHVAFTRSGISNPVNMYLDGVLSFTASTSVDEIGEDNQEPLVVGTNPGNTNGTRRFYGILDDVRIYTSDRSSTIDDDMNKYPNVNDNNLNAYFDFNLERHNDTITSVPNMATGSGASSASLTSVTGSPKVVRTWDVSTVGSDTVLTFERTVLTAQGGWRVPIGVSSADALVVGGGGGGGYNTGGGGGGGGVGFYNSTALSAGSSVVVIVGQGGQGSTTNTANGANGQASKLGTSVVGGGGGGAGWASSGANGSDAPTGSPAYDKNGSGGGASNTNGLGGTGETDGGDGASDAGAGGGGAGEDGENAPSSNNGGDGGDGLNSSITGSSVMYGSGAGGGSWNSYGNGGAGAGDGGTSTAATHGTTNRGGGGGGGGGGSRDGANGGSGVVIVRFASVDHNDWSVATWINASSLQGSTIIGTYNDDGQASDIGWALRIRAANGNLYSTVGTSMNSSAAWTSDASIDTDRWYHVVMVADVGNTLRLYLDGVNVANGSLSSGGNIRDVSNNVFLGSYNGGEEEQPFDGQIGSVMVFADALNATNINQLYTSGKGVYSNTTNLSYSASSYTFTNGQTYSLPISVSAGEVTTSYSLTGSLPSGMNFESSNGTIWGTPTADMSSTNYTVTANNSAGSFSTTFSMQIMSAPSGITYSPSSMTLEKGTAMTTNTPTYSGSTVTSWSISPSLPSGLSIDASTGAISGTPSVLQTSSQSYTVTATNGQGSATTSISIIINDQIAKIAYSTIEISNNREMTTATPTNTGGAVTSWEITPSLPTGLLFGTTNGSIWGTPENLTSASLSFTVWANNSGGANSTTATLELNWTLTPSVDGILLTRNSTMSPDINWEWDYEPLEADAIGLATGEWNTCAIGSDGLVYCWGRNGNGQIGNGQTSTNTCGNQGHKCKDVPTATSLIGNSGDDIVSIAFGRQHACALLDTGYVECWGRNNGGQLGQSGGAQSKPQPVNLGAGRTATSIYAGGHYSCAILDDESVKCWGQNTDGQLGIGSTSNTNTPTTINSLGSGRKAITLATAFNSICALLDDGTVKCWGDDSKGQLGNGGSNSDLNSPPSSAINLGSGRTAKAITGGEYHFCAILDDDSIKCWGDGSNGKLGTGSISDKNTPTSTSGSFASGRYAVVIEAGYQHTCVILDNGDLTCWGGDAWGQLGNGATTGTKSSLQSSVVGLGTGRTAISLSAGGTHTCAQLDNGQLMCWGNRADGQVGDNGGFGNSVSDRTSPSAVNNNNNGGNTYLDTGIFPTGAVSGATCGISPALPTGLSLTTGTCAITGTPTVTAVNATYTVWANISGQSFSGQVWIEVGLNAPIPSYSPNSYTYTKGTAITPITATNSGGEVVSWDFDSTFPSGLNLGASNGTIWGTPDTITSTTTYTIWANNSAGSASTTITFTVNDVPPSISYSASSLSLLKGAQMSALAVTNSGGAIVSCSVSPALPNGMLLSSTCELSGTPTIAATNASYTITATNTGGSDSASIYIEVLNSGGTLTVTPTHSTGSVNATLASIAASYSHSLTIPSWTSGVTNTSVEINNSASVAGTAIAAWDNGNLAIAWTRPIYGGTTQHVLALSTYDGSSWTTQDIDTSSRTGYRPSIAIDNQGALHIAYLDRDNTNLRYATNASGSWVLSTLDTSSVNPNNDAAKTGIAIDNRGHVHIIHPVQGSSVWVLNYTTNVSGSFVSTTITDTTKDDGKYASLAIAGNGSLHISVYRDSGGSDLRYYTDESGVWTNETVHTGNNYGKDSAIALNSKDEVVIVYRKDDTADDIYMSVGNRGSWTSSQVASNRYASYLAVAIDSNDDVHISSHNIRSQSGYCCNKDLEYFTNSSGSWVRTTVDSGVGGIFGSIVIDSNDDVHISHADNIGGNDLFYATVKGSGKGLAVNPVFSVSPSLPDGLILNWKTGEITGTPTAASNNTTYTLTALALGATTTTTFTLHVTGAPGEIVYTDILGTKGVAITPVTPIISLNGTTGGISSWAINSSLPTGLNFGTSNGTIWGTPTQVIAGAVFTIWANNSVGSKSTTINITINDISVSGITYSSENITLSYYHTMTTTTPSTTGGSATSWAISPTLPSGLTFNTATGAISGTPETLQTTTVTYTIWANNSGGSFSDQINITINDHAPAPINYFGDNITLDYNQTITPIGDFEVKPDLIAAGEDHTCAIQSDGSVRCWGEGSYGRLGHGGSGDKNTPTATASLGAGRTAIDITAGGTHTCAVLDNGSVACWGLNDYGQLGDGTTTNRNTPTQTLSLGRPAIAVEAGSHFSTCALLDNGSVSCWGRNHKGQLGRGFTNSTADLSQRTPALTVPMPGGLPVVALDISHYMVCGVLSDGSIACWGQYGGGNTPSLQTFFNSSNPAIDVSTGRYAGCGLLENGSVTCWGTAWLGTGGESQSANAGVIWPNLGSGRTAVQIEMGRKHRCVLLDDDSVKCWGDDQYGQLGNGAGQGSKNAPYTTSFSSNLGLQNMVSGHWHTCIASKTNEIYCWGDGASGKLGDGSTNFNGVPGKTSHFSGTNPVKAHGEITSWAIHPALPTGLSFGSTNGTLYGRPTASLAQTNFTVYANNSGGSSTFILNLGVNPAPPGPFEYVPENNSITNNSLTQIAPSFVNGTNTGGTVASWAINNTSLPTGLTFSTSNGTIYGTPTQLWTTTAYKVWANNSGGSSVAYLNITVVDELPTISYSPENLTLTNNTASSDLPLAPTITGSGAITSWTLNNTNLPTGLSFGSTNGTLYGTATELWTRTAYKVWANNSGGSVEVFFNLTVNDQVPTGITYSPENVTLTNNTVSSDLPLVPSITGSGAITSWELNNTNLPTGISFGSANGTLYGTATQLWTTTAYKVWANNSGGSVEVFFNLTVNDQVPTGITYSPENVTLTNNTASSDLPLAPTITGSGAITSWELNNTNLPTGISFGSANGTLYGTATQLWTTTAYKVWANNSGGSVVAYLNLTVIDQVPTGITYSPENVTLTNNTASSDLPLVPSVTGSGAITSWELNNTNLPTGISFGSANGTLYGTATQLWTTTAYKVWANNTGGSVVAYFNLTVNDQIPTLSYSPNTLVLTKGNQSSDLPLNATLTGSGEITSWAINATLPAGLNFGTSNGTIWGIPTVLQTTAVTYTIWANNTGGSSATTVTITINDEAPGPFEYIPENNTWTNNTEVHLAPQFINQTTGNGSTWQVANINSGVSNSNPGFWMEILVGDTLYFSADDGSTGHELWAHDFSNHSTWQVADINSGSGTSWPGAYMHLLVGDTIYFSASDGSTGEELWAHDTSNHSTWQVADIYSGASSSSSKPGFYMEILVGDTLYFSANDGSTGYELWAHDTSNHSTWRVADINSGNTGSEPGMHMSVLVGDTIYFDAGATGGRELWAHNISNQSTWRVVDIHTGSIGSDPGDRMALLVGDTIYFDADDGSKGDELWAHDTSNHSTWRVTDINSGSSSSAPGHYMSILVGDTVYFSAYTLSSGHELWAHDTSNHSTWQVADINNYIMMNGGGLSSYPGQYMAVPLGDTIYFSAAVNQQGTELWAHDTSNFSTWKVADIDASIWGSEPGYWMEILVGDTLYFSADDGSTGYELWAHDTSNHSTWRVADINSGSGSSDPGNYLEGHLIGDTIYFSANDGSTGSELWAHRPFSIDYNTNTGGNVTTWAINASLPSGLTFSTTNGSIYGTPTEMWNQTAYMVWANNSGGSSVAYLNITVVDELPTISYSPENVTLTNNTASSDLPLVPSITGSGAITSWTLNNTNLPSGISFGSSNGTLYGTATQLWTRTSYKVWANNSGGSVVAYFNLTVNDQVPTGFSYTPENVTLTNNTASSDLPLVPSVTGSGAITSWELNNTNLPSGISFGSSNGTLYGTATQLWTKTAYKVWANNYWRFSCCILQPNSQ